MTEIMVRTGEERAPELTLYRDSSKNAGSAYLRLEHATTTASPTAAPTGYQRGGKRLLDLALSSLALLLLSPVLVAVWVALRLALGPKLLLSQQRVGQDGRVFGLYKFRTMRPDRRETWSASASCDFDGVDRRHCHKSSTDPRHIAVGQLIRRYSLDELPQLLNVLKGEMSLVGPRPELLAAASSSFIAHPRHRVRPGLTGPYQTSSLRSEGKLSQGLQLDKRYCERITLRQDIGYLFATAVALLRGTGS